MKTQRVFSRPQRERDGDQVQTSLPHSSPLEWQFLREGEPWESQVAMPDGATPDQGAGIGRTRGIKAIYASLIILSICLTLYLWRRAEIGAQILESELRATIAAEVQATQRPSDHQVNPAVRTPATTVQMQEITYHGNIVSVQVESNYTEPNGESYRVRQRNFYLRTSSGWVRVPPSSDILGARHILETDFFTFSYHQLDATSVEAVAAEFDAVYTDLRKDYGLSPAAERTIVVFTSDPTKVEFACYKPTYLCLSSPALAALPSDLLESDALRLWLLNALVYQVYWDATQTSPFRYEWRDAEIVLSHLQMRQHSALVSAWHTDLVRWLYAIPARTPKPDTETLVQELAHLCDRHKIGARREFFRGATLLYMCTHPKMLNLWLLTNYPTAEQVGHLRMPDPDLRMSDRSWGGDYTWIEILEVEVLLDYIVATYGREALPALVEGFRSHGSWNTLVPAVFGISVEEFERGWHEYLQNLP